MTASRSFLDELDFRFAPLESVRSLAGTSPSLSLSIPTGNPRRSFNQSVPLFSRQPPTTSSDPTWPAYCGLLREYGVPLYSRMADLDMLPVASVPSRFAQRLADEPFDFMEMETADAFELTCFRRNAHPDSELSSRVWSNVPTLPIEIVSPEELSQLVDNARDLTGGGTPIGIGMLLGAVTEDIQLAIDSHVDYVVIQTPSQPLASVEFQLALAVSQAAHRIRKSNSRVMLFLDAPLVDPISLVKLLMLGADAIAIDSLLKHRWPSTPNSTPLPKGLLSGIGSLPSAPTSSIVPVENALRDLTLQLKQVALQLGVARWMDVDAGHLQPLSSAAEQLLANALR